MPALRKKRFARQIAFPAIGLEGQQKLARARVVLAGCGGLGSTLAQCMARSGIAAITLIDHDRVALANIHRQTLFTEKDAEKKVMKARAAAREIKKADSALQVTAVVERLDRSNADRLLAGHHLVLDGSDNMETRFVINDWCVKNRVPWVYGGVAGSQGMVMAVLPGQGPCLACLTPDRYSVQEAPGVAMAGIVNTAPVAVAALQVTEAIKILIESKDVITDLRVIDLWTGECQRVRVSPADACMCSTNFAK